MKRIIIAFALSVFGLSLHAALTVTPQVPIANQNNVPTGTQIVLLFSENVALGSDSCYLNGQLLKSTSITGKYAFFKNVDFEYGTKYEMFVPEGAFISKSNKQAFPALSYSFTTLARPKPEKHVFDVIVAADGTGDYTSLRKAVKEAPKNQSEPWLIFVKNGEYEELIRTDEKQTFLSIVGESPEKTIIKYAITSGGGDLPTENGRIAEAEGLGPVLAVKGTDFYIHNVTLQNSFGYEKQAGPQALALRTLADRFTAFNTRMYSYQDTWQTGSDMQRHYVKRCFIEGAVDFIYCSGECYFDSCTISFCRNGSVLTAPSHGVSKYGYVFRDCNIVSSKPGTKRTENIFGRPWHNQPRCALINTTISKDISISSKGWINHMGGLPVVFAEYNTMDADGKPLDLKNRNTWYWVGGTESKPEQTCTAKSVLTKEEADDMTVAHAMRGTDNWRPDYIVSELEAPEVTFRDSMLYWNDNDYAICYMILRDGKFEAFVTENHYRFIGHPDQYRVRSVNEYGTLGIVSKAPKAATDLHNGGHHRRLKATISNNRLSVSNPNESAEVQFYTLSGQCIRHIKVYGTQEIDLSEFPSLIIRISTGKESLMLKKV